MIVTERPYHPRDAYQIDAVGYLSEESKEEVQISTEAWTICSGDTVVCIWGKLTCWDNRAALWGVMAKESRSCMKQIFEFAHAKISKMTELRLELQVLCGFEPGVRFAEMLGFERECIMRKYSDGLDAYLYARVL